MATTGLSLVGANFTAIVLGSVLHGGFLVLLYSSLYLFYRRFISLLKSQRRENGYRFLHFCLEPLAASSILMFISNTSHFTLMIYRFYQATCLVDGGKNPKHFYSDFSILTQVLDYTFVVVSIAIGDLVIIYRLWIVWDRRLSVIVLPLLCVVGLITSCTQSTYILTQMRPGESLYVSGIAQWLCGWAFVLCTTVYSSGLIAYRIWKINQQTVRLLEGPSQNVVVAAVIESALIYTIWTTLFVITFLLKSNTSIIIMLTWPGVSGITCMLITARAALRGVNEVQVAERNVPLPKVEVHRMEDASLNNDRRTSREEADDDELVSIRAMFASHTRR